MTKGGASKLLDWPGQERAVVASSATGDSSEEMLNRLGKDSQKWKIAIPFPHICAELTLYSLLVQAAEPEFYPRIYEK
jgi:hypothetical protein